MQVVQHCQKLLSATRFPEALAAAVPSEVQGTTLQRAALSLIDDLIFPRLESLDAPLLVVVGGSTGAGKSTLVNSLVGEMVSPASAVRPTTRTPLLLASAEAMPFFASDRVLPKLVRVTDQSPPNEPLNEKPNENPDEIDAETDAMRGRLAVQVSPNIPNNLALVDAPDIDSVEDANRALSQQLLDAADLWLFVTTATRYADAAAWTVLDQAAARGLTIGVVLSRVPVGASPKIVPDLQRLLESRGLGDAPLFVVEEGGLGPTGLLPHEQVAPIDQWLRSLADDKTARLQVAQNALAGALHQLGEQAGALADLVQIQEESVAAMQTVVTRNYEQAEQNLLTAASDGSLLRGEVLSRWQDYVGTSDLLRSFEQWFSRLRDSVGGWLRGVPSATAEVEEEITSGLALVLVDEAGHAAQETYSDLQDLPAGKTVFSDPRFAQVPANTEQLAVSVVQDWQADLVELVGQQTPKKRQQARFLSLGVNTVAVALMLVVFASTGGLLGGELAIAGGSAVLGQKILETVFGDQAIRSMAREAERLLQERSAGFFAVQASGFQQVLDSLQTGVTAEELRDCAASLQNSNGARLGKMGPQR